MTHNDGTNDMTTPVRILAFAGSLRRDSFNKKLVKLAMRSAERAGAEVTYLDLKDYPVPVYDGDIGAEHGFSDNVMTLKEMFRAHHGLLISAPEYNSSISGALKNVIDWVSRPEKGHAALDCFDGKVAGLVSAAAGGLGGMRMLPMLRSILQNIKVIVVPAMIGIPAAHEAFNDDGTLKDAKKQAAVEAVAADVAGLLMKIHAAD